MLPQKFVIIIIIIIIINFLLNILLNTAAYHRFIETNILLCLHQFFQKVN